MASACARVLPTRESLLVNYVAAGMTHCTSWLHAVFEGSLYVPFEDLCH